MVAVLANDFVCPLREAPLPEPIQNDTHVLDGTYEISQNLIFVSFVYAGGRECSSRQAERQVGQQKRLVEGHTNRQRNVAHITKANLTDGVLLHRRSQITCECVYASVVRRYALVTNSACRTKPCRQRASTPTLFKHRRQSKTVTVKIGIIEEGKKCIR